MQACILSPLVTQRWHAACFNEVMKRISMHRACFLTLLVMSTGLHAEPGYLQPDELQRWAENFLDKRFATSGGAVVHATAGAVDSRLRPQRCGGELQGIMPAAAQVSARMTLGVRCASPAWTIYISMTLETELNVLVLRTAAARDSSPADADVELQQRRVPGIATTYLTSPAQLRGRHLKMAVGPGTALTMDMLVADTLVKRGQRVTIVAGGNGMEIRAQGEAVADSTPTGRVRVLNLSSRKVVEGQAETSDRVRVSL